ncbi:uncharacterized protein METZ01_LOCUS378858 [marine metagenome]|uniref:Uncharacterized protein n=1 Tax=marine metagenome TaxID=408172 RepID=A0A382TVB9_9ZZZZ
MPLSVGSTNIVASFTDCFAINSLSEESAFRSSASLPPSHVTPIIFFEPK